MVAKKVYLIASVAVFACSVAYAAHTSHFWSKVSQADGLNGQVVCQWKCGYGQDQHHATTSGYGTCPTKY